LVLAALSQVVVSLADRRSDTDAVADTDAGGVEAALTSLGIIVTEDETEDPLGEKAFDNQGDRRDSDKRIIGNRLIVVVTIVSVWYGPLFV